MAIFLKKMCLCCPPGGNLRSSSGVFIDEEIFAVNVSFICLVEVEVGVKDQHLSFLNLNYLLLTSCFKDFSLNF